MSRTKRLIMAIVCAVILLTNRCCAENAAPIYNAAIGKLENYRDKADVESALEGFSDIKSDYGKVSLLILYAEAILDIHDENFQAALNILKLLGENQDFTRLLDDLGNEYYLPNCNELMIYANARISEDEEDYTTAKTLYATILGVWDTGNRYLLVSEQVGEEELQLPEDETEPKASPIQNKEVDALRAQFEIGNTVVFGHYEQDNNTSDGLEPIEWIVLETNEKTAALISKYALDCKLYNTEDTSVTWETCTLRKWLISDFLNAAFTADEQAQLATVTVTADKNPSYSTNPGNDTQDKVYLMSINETNKLFSSDSERVCYPTEYAKAHGAWTNDSGACWWWLRSPGNDTNYAAKVNYYGEVSNFGYYLNRDEHAIRPVVALRLQ